MLGLVWSTGSSQELEVIPVRGGEEVMSRVTNRKEDTEGLRVILEVYGRSPEGKKVEIRQKLPERFHLDSSPYQMTPGGWSSRDLHRRILYKSSDGKLFVIGVAIHNVSPHNGLTLVFAGLTNVEWDFDVDRQEFWLDVDPKSLPPNPVEFYEEDWKGVRFGIPKDLQKFTVAEATARIEARGGLVVERGEKADVVVLQDHMDFAWSRNKDAEEWMRGGAKVLLEKDFRRMVRNGT